jgi:hypothetical protein
MNIPSFKSMRGFVTMRLFMIAAAITTVPRFALGQAEQIPLLVLDKVNWPDINPLPVNDNIDGVIVKPGTKLRILCAGDSITQGTLSDTDGGDGNGFRLRLRENLRSK